MLRRRSLLRGLLAAPAIIRTPGLLMAIVAPREGVALTSVPHPIEDFALDLSDDLAPYTVTMWGFDAFNRLHAEEIIVRPPKLMESKTAWREIHGIELSSDRPDRGWSISHS